MAAVYIICTVLVVAVPAVASPAETGVGCLMILTAVPVYLLLLEPSTRIGGLNSITGKPLIDSPKEEVSHVLLYRPMLTGDTPPNCSLTISLLSELRRYTAVLLSRLYYHRAIICKHYCVPV